MAYRLVDEFMWSSDGAAPWGKYIADDETVHDTAQEAMARNKEIRERRAPAKSSSTPAPLIEKGQSGK